MADLIEIVDKLIDITEDAINSCTDSNENALLWECHDFLQTFREQTKYRIDNLIAEGYHD